MPHERLGVKLSIDSMLSTSSSEFEDDIQHPEWYKNNRAKVFCFNVISAMYAFVLVIVSLVIELSSTWQSRGMSNCYTAFCILMYGISIAFFIHLYFFIVYPQALNYLIEKFSGRFGIKIRTFEPPKHDGEGAGTLYLRLGALIFGLFGSVLYGTEIFLCFYDQKRNASWIVRYILAVIFTFIQIHFIFCNSKIKLKKTDFLASFGMMHCIAVNLWSWISLCMAKTNYKVLKKAKKATNYASNYTKNAYHSSYYDTTTEKSLASLTFRNDEQEMRVLTKLGSGANFLLTTQVEFSLIAAAVCFIIWKYKGDETHREGRKKMIRFDCKRTTIGIFAGLLIFIASLVCIAMTIIFNKDSEAKSADDVVGYGQLILFIITGLAVIFALFRMRRLQYRLHSHGEVIDEILLIVGLAGEVIYCCTALDVYIHEKRSSENPPCLVVIVFTIRIIQVIIQSVFILISSRLRCLNKSSVLAQPGKQTITFMLICNLTLFIFHTYETIESSFGFPTNLSSNYSVLLYVSSPLVVFYRFHSSACLAEIWKVTYSPKQHGHKKIPKVEIHEVE